MNEVEKASDKKILIIEGAGDKAFCSGIDLLELLTFSKEQHLTSNRIPSNIMVHASQYKKPYVALIDGITFGGASFLSMAAKYRVATERTSFAMPEAKIGFYNNAGSSYFLSRLKYNLGYYIALSCARINGYDVKKFGLATHYICSDQTNGLIENLGKCESDHDARETIESFEIKPPSTSTELDKYIPIIDKCFDGDSVEEIFENLHLDGSEWAMKTIRTMNTFSPTALKICHRVLKLGKELSLKDCLRMENRLTVSLMTQKSDLNEGVRALLIDRDGKPNWDPKSLKEVKEERIKKLFEKLPEEYELTFDLIPSKL